MTGRRYAFIEPHLGQYGGVRRIVELSNALVRAGHEVAIYLPEGERTRCEWLACDARIEHLPLVVRERFDAVVFNDEPQWYLLDRFVDASARVAYHLHHGALYTKPGSWESVRVPVDLRLANSRWTADAIEAETGARPQVLLGGINPAHFRPVSVAKRHPLLCVGDPRPWKGTDTIREAAEILGLPLRTYFGRGHAQGELASVYGSAEVFVVGSHHEGFGQPGLEALACGVPLVTTDNGGSREYASDGETALVVPPRDAIAMAAAIDRLRNDAGLRDRLVENGLALVRDRFDWDRSAADFTAALDDRPPRPTERRLRQPPPDPELSIVVLTWDQLHHTQRCVESIRRNTDVSYELIIVDNGSAPPAASYAAQAADSAVLNEANLGFAAGMNQGLATARGRSIAFLNNDTVVPAGWAGGLLAHAGDPTVGLVVPAVTAAGNARTVRGQPGGPVERLRPFEAPPSGVVYLMRTEVARQLGGWGEEYRIASAEDVDLCFKIWVNGLDVVFVPTVLVDHVGKGTAGPKLGDHRALWASNRAVFLTKWRSDHIDVPRLASCDPAQFERNLEVARSVTGWMAMYFSGRANLLPAFARRRILRVARPLAAKGAAYVSRHRNEAWVRRLREWSRRDPRIDRLVRRLR